MTNGKNYFSIGYYLRYVILFLIFADVAAAHGTKDEQLISPADLASEIAAHQVIDLRSLEDYRQAHVPGALLLPLQEISQQRLQALGVVSDSPVILYGVSETTAVKGKRLLGVLGYENVRILAGGFTHWVEDGQDVESGAAPSVSGVKTGEMGPGLEIIPELQELGVIQKVNGIVSTLFMVKNISASEILITEITTSCGCTTAEIEEKSIPAGEARKLSVYFDPNFHKEPDGKFSRTVFLQTSNNAEILAKISVEIVK